MLVLMLVCPLATLPMHTGSGIVVLPARSDLSADDTP